MQKTINDYLLWLIYTALQLICIFSIYRIVTSWHTSPISEKLNMIIATIVLFVEIVAFHFLKLLRNFKY